MNSALITQTVYLHTEINSKKLKLHDRKHGLFSRVNIIFNYCVNFCTNGLRA